MKQFLKHFIHGDRIIWTCYAFMVIISMVFMFSAASTFLLRGQSLNVGPVIRHSIFLLGGVVVAVIIHNINARYYLKISWVAIIGSILLLAATHVIGTKAAGAARFLNLFGFQFQPSEIAKLSIILFLADTLIECKKASENVKMFYLRIALIATAILLIMTENLSTAILISTVCLLMMIIGQVPFKRIVSLMAIALGFITIIMTIAFTIPEENIDHNGTFYKVFGRSYTWKGRIEHFMDSDTQDQDPFEITDENFQINNAQIAIARGNYFWGVGPSHSIQRNILPEASNDFIIAIMIEEYGSVWTVLLVSIIYLILLFRVMLIARRCPGEGQIYLMIGLILLMTFQALIHIAVSAQVIPLTGQPLPLISQGGTSIICISSYLGIILGISHWKGDIPKEKPTKKEEESMQEDAFFVDLTQPSSPENSETTFQH